MRERSVAVEMVLCDVEKNADRGVERRREVDLIRGALDDVSARLIWRGQREDGGADVTADLGVAASRAQQMRNERGGRRLAVGSSDGNERCCRRTGPALAAKQLDISYHLNAGSPREPHRPVRRRVRERHAGGEHKRGNSLPVDLPQVTARNARTRRLGDGLGAVVPTDDVRPARKQGARACQSRPTQAEDGDLLSGEGGDRDHHRSLSVDSPTSASTTEIIQNRITICGSVQPSCSKW